VLDTQLNKLIRHFIISIFFTMHDMIVYITIVYKVDIN
jgi:hypothetical protein